MMILILARTILYVAVGYMISRMMAAQRQQRQALAQANAQLSHYAATLEQLSVSRERNRLARELHDTLAHTLSGVTVQLAAVSALWATDAKAARAILDQSMETTRTGLTETRRALQALRTSPLEDLGLALALQNLAESLAARTGLALDLHLSDHLDDLGPAAEQCVYRVAQEALANVDRHANARRLSVQLDRQDQQLILTIADDGRGFAPSAALLDGQFGLKGMQERAEIAGGKLEVESCPGGGTKVRLNVPACGCEA
jgi:signal transduction histidine kinase